MLALYIHWPFCKSKCPYCDFNSHVREEVEQDRWRKALVAELRHMAAWMPDESISSIFFGGGTPSLMPADTVAAVIDEAAKLFDMANDIEITLEANPTSAESKSFTGFRAAGVNRLSLGVQSLRDESLLFLKREHSAKEALKAVDLANSLFDRTSFDLIYALPKQSAKCWELELLEALKYAKDHLSLYQLTIEPNTAFHHEYHHKKTFKLPKDGLSEELFLITQQIMGDVGRPAYEISNHAKLGEESRHNLAYWTGGAYLGVGAGAHGRVLIDGDWHATSTYKSPERWLERVERDGHAVEHLTLISQQDRAQEQILTSLRLRDGIELTPQLLAHLDADKVDFYAKQGLLETESKRLRATHNGWLVLNQLLSEIII